MLGHFTHNWQLWGVGYKKCICVIVCSTSLMASLIRSVGGVSKCFYQGLWLAGLNADVIGQSINRQVAKEFPHHVTDSSSFSAQFLNGFPYRFQWAWTVLWSMRHLLDFVQVGAWNSLFALWTLQIITRIPIVERRWSLLIQDVLLHFSNFFYYFMFRAWNDSIWVANLSIRGRYAETS